MMTLAAEALAHGEAWGPGPWWPIFPLFWVLFWGVLIFAVFRFRRRWDRPDASRSADGVLAERYARGEISEQDFRERQRVLKNSGS